jgi:hypothetical protein
VETKQRDVSASLRGSCYEENSSLEWVKRFSEGRESVTDDGQQQAELKKTLQKFVRLCAKIVG